MKWYLALTVLDLRWMAIVGLIIICLYIGILAIIMACKTDEYWGSMFDPDRRKGDNDCEKNYQRYLRFRRPMKYVAIGLLSILVTIWPTRGRVVEAVALSSVESYLVANPQSKLNPAQLPELADRLVTSANNAMGLLDAAINKAKDKLSNTTGK